MTSPLRLGNEAFWLSDADAAEVQRLCAFDRQAGLALARRRAHRASVTVSMMAMDAAPAPAPSPSPSQNTRTNPMTAMVKIRVGDADRYVDEAVAREIEYLRGTATALTAIVQGNVQPSAPQPVMDTETSLRLAARDAFREREAAACDPNTARGKFLRHLKTAHLNPPNHNG